MGNLGHNALWALSSSIPSSDLGESWENNVDGPGKLVCNYVEDSSPVRDAHRLFDATSPSFKEISVSQGQLAGV